MFGFSGNTNPVFLILFPVVYICFWGIGVFCSASAYTQWCSTWQVAAEEEDASIMKAADVAAAGI